MWNCVIFHVPISMVCLKITAQPALILISFLTIILCWQIHTLEEPFLNVNCAHLESYDPSLYRQLVCYPQEVIPTFDMAINEMFFERYPAAVLEHQIQVRPFNAQKTKNMRSLNPEGGYPYTFLNKSDFSWLVFYFWGSSVAQSCEILNDVIYNFSCKT